MQYPVRLHPSSSILSLALFVLCTLELAWTEVADYGTVPKGSNPTLFDPETDPIIQLDESTFNDTVLCSERGEQCTSFVVEFYSDWCGHCRAYAPVYKSLAKDIHRWSKVVRVGAMNCADSMNEVVCRSNGILFFPYIKYYQRNGSEADSADVKLRPLQSQSEMRDQITEILLKEYTANHFPDWPVFDRLGDVTTYGDLWAGAQPNVTSMAIVFESDAQSLVGAQLLLDLAKHKNRLLARRCLKDHPLVDALHVTDFPTLAIFRRGERTPVLVAELRRLLLNELEDYLREETSENIKRVLTFGSRKNHSASSGGNGHSNTNNNHHDLSAAALKEEQCTADVESCRAQYYVSELDMLKALRYALVREVTRTGAPLAGKNLTALYGFLNALAHNFPHSTLDYTLNDADGSSQIFLNASGRARVVFTHMRNYIEQRGLDEPLSVEDWQAEFTRAEEDQGKPFPVNADWEHCKGSSPYFRGYTCGLWIALHAVTVNDFRGHRHDAHFRPIPTLHAIRDYVGHFFGCEHCRHHFLKMTTRTAKIETHVKRREDGVLYLWKAHNMVNSRLRGRDTEDPEYPKFNFPASFLCPECRPNGSKVRHEGENGEQMDERAVKEYLLRFYSQIKPIA